MTLSIKILHLPLVAESPPWITMNFGRELIQNTDFYGLLPGAQWDRVQQSALREGCHADTLVTQLWQTQAPKPELQHTALGKSNNLSRPVFPASIHTKFTVGPQPPLSVDHTGVILGKEEEQHPMNQLASVHSTYCQLHRNGDSPRAQQPVVDGNWV